MTPLRDSKGRFVSEEKAWSSATLPTMEDYNLCPLVYRPETVRRDTLWAMGLMFVLGLLIGRKLT